MNFSKIFFKVDQPRPFCLFSFCFKHNFTEKTVGFSEIQTQIVGVEGQHADHLTTTTAPEFIKFSHMDVLCSFYLHDFSLFTTISVPKVVV